MRAYAANFGHGTEHTSASYPLKFALAIWEPGTLSRLRPTRIEWCFSYMIASREQAREVKRGKRAVIFPVDELTGAQKS